MNDCDKHTPNPQFMWSTQEFQSGEIELALSSGSGFCCRHIRKSVLSDMCTVREVALFGDTTLLSADHTGKGDCQEGALAIGMAIRVRLLLSQILRTRANPWRQT